MITPDGIGIVYASKILGHSLKERVAGYDMLHALLGYRERSMACTKIFLLGSSPEVVQSASKKLAELYGRVHISGFHHGFFKKNSMEESSIVEMISREKPDLLLVGLGSPKQEDFIHRFKDKLGASVMIGVGGSFDILSGRICRAPVIFRRLGFEWLYRLICQPRRIKRQIILPVFVCLVLLQRLMRRSAVEVTTSE
jgi:N-acetylglucosaminyldiphosphoundecaprenol N-acetyl-beta-D-mannosaminyltransferase